MDEYENARMCMCRIDDACTPYRERVRRCVFVSSVANWRCTGRGAADDDEDRSDDIAKFTVERTIRTVWHV